MMKEFIVISITTLVAATAWLINFAIKEYFVFQKLKIPSRIFKYGFIYMTLLLFWNLSAHTIYSKMLPFIPSSKIIEVNKSIGFRMADSFTMIFFVVFWLFIWACVHSIDVLAKHINKAREELKFDEAKRSQQ